MVLIKTPIQYFFFWEMKLVFNGLFCYKLGNPGVEEDIEYLPQTSALVISWIPFILVTWTNPLANLRLRRKSRFVCGNSESQRSIF